MQTSVEPRIGRTRLGQGISRMRDFDLGPDLRIALGPAAMRAASKGRTHDRTRPHCKNVIITLAKGEPSTHAAASESAFSEATPATRGKKNHCQTCARRAAPRLRTGCMTCRTKFLRPTARLLPVSVPNAESKGRLLTSPRLIGLQVTPCKPLREGLLELRKHLIRLLVNRLPTLLR